MLVYGTQGISDPNVANLGSLKAAYDYRAFGEQVDLTMPNEKVTETFTGKELDDETELSYFGARYLDQMLGLWVSVDAKRQFNSPYLYAGNGTNPVNGVDEDGNDFNKYGEDAYQVMQNGRLNESPTNANRINRSRNDHSTLYNIIPSSQPRIVKVKPEKGYQKTYDVYIPIKPNEDKTDLSLITYILMGHELDHPYTPAKPGHNGLESVNSVGEYLDKIKKMSTDEKPDQ
ncbi:MAG: hypothetical protein GX638_10705, partial [Crenarchaeota archaeon]|nr:hypothetical protein [Thermoproteota archaeon]